jgi:hypothetical protein
MKKFKGKLNIHKKFRYVIETDNPNYDKLDALEDFKKILLKEIHDVYFDQIVVKKV